MRLFTAIPLTEESKKLVTEITRGRLPVPYINTTNLHITLNFFGELDDAQVDKVKKIFDSFAKGQERFLIEFDQLVKSNDQIHLTIKANPRLTQLRNLLHKQFELQGLKLDSRAYYPHVKLTNLHFDKVMNPERTLDNFPHEELQKLNFTAEQIILYESKLLLHHPKHIPIIELSLV